jgi:ParB-like chromosome segregation protein Spo0J
MIERVPIDSLHLDPANAREHPAENLAAIAASLRRFGQQEPVVVDANNVVRDGNGTLTAAQSLGWTEIDVTRSELAGAEMTAYAIAANRTAELAEWDRLPLAETLTELASAGLPLEDVGFSELQLEDLKGELADEVLAQAEKAERKAAAADQVDKPFRPPDKFLLEFDDVDQYDHWFAFLAWLKIHENYGHPDTIAGRLDLFLAGQGFAE